MNSFKEKNPQSLQQNLFPNYSPFKSSTFPLVEGLSFQNIVLNVDSTKPGYYCFLYDNDQRKANILDALVNKFQKEKILIICLDKKQSQRLANLAQNKTNIHIAMSQKEIDRFKEQFFYESGFEQDLYANKHSFLIIFYDFTFSAQEINLIKSFKNKFSSCLISPSSEANFNQAIKIFQPFQIYNFSNSPSTNAAVSILDKHNFLPFSQEYMDILDRLNSLLLYYEKYLRDFGFQTRVSFSNSSQPMTWKDVNYLKNQIKNYSGNFKKKVNNYYINLIYVLKLKDILLNESYELLKQELEANKKNNLQYYEGLLLALTSSINQQNLNKKSLLSNKLRKFFSEIKTIKENEQPLKALVLTKRKQFSLFIYSKLKQLNIKSICYSDRNESDLEEQYKILNALNRSEVDVVVASLDAILKTPELPPIPRIYLLNSLYQDNYLTQLKELVSKNFDQGLINFNYYFYSFK